MDYREKVQKIFMYLLNLKNLNEKITRSVYDYNKLYWKDEFLNVSGCILNRSSLNDSWIEIREKSSKLYDEFFKLYQQNEKDGENFEIILGHGILCWNIGNLNIIHPVIETKMKIEFNNEKKAFSLVPSGKTLFQSSIFQGIDKIDIRKISNISDKINNINLDPRIKEEIKSAFQDIICAIGNGGKIQSGPFLKDKLKFAEFPVLYDTFVVFKRKTNMKLWQNEISSIIDGLKKGCKIPETVKAFVREEKSDTRDEKAWSKVSQNVLFPLPANLQQKEIIKRISKNYGVVMQGPPGTGKSHTIANLICHLLANGKRILVTSQTERALRVLTNKIPEEIRPLCISLLGNDTDSFKKLNESVIKITDNLSLDASEIYKQVDLLKRQLNSCLEKQKILYRKLKEVQSLENETVSYSGKTYTVVDMAKWVRENNGRYSWIQDDISIKNSMPISNNEFELMMNLLREVTKEEKYKFDRTKNIIDELPEDMEFSSIIYRYKMLKKKYEHSACRIKDWHIPNKHRCDYDKLLETVSYCKDNIDIVRGNMWENIFKGYHENESMRHMFRDLYFKSNNLLMKIDKLSNELRSHKIKLPEINIHKFIKDFENIYEVLDERKKISRIFKITHPEYKYIFTCCSVDDELFSDMDQAFIIKLFIQKKNSLDELNTIWENTISDYGKNEKIDIFKIQDNMKKLSLIINWDKEYKSNILNKLGKIALPRTLDWYSIETYDHLEKGIESLKIIDEYSQVKAYLDTICKLEESLEIEIHHKDMMEKTSDDEINKISCQLKNIKNIKKKVSTINKIMDKLGRVCPNTVSNIIENWSRGKYIYNDFEKAWKWCQWNSLLKKILALNSDKIEEDLENEKAREKIIIRELVSKSTWYNQIVNTKDIQKRSLFSWMQAVKRIGKGRSKMVSKYRKIAQDEMEKCKSAIPVWIMPLNKVIENIKLSEDLFDVVIFDESSQSDIFSICALMRAERAVIVGDDKQISPETIGIDHNSVERLINIYLEGIPDKQWFDVQTSLYDMALRVFPNRLMLKEHFRCVPEIINFSNNLVYSRGIKALRYPTLNETFSPPIKAVKVSGYRDPVKPVNNIEARAVASKIVECCNDKKYNGMTMGVISLLGEPQGSLIENILRKELGVEEMIKRKIICGDAYSFQGDERDIMFLSMVISKDVKFAPLSRESDVRRFNVASSRARNQMWIFHSIDLENLSKECVRYSLLNYCMNYNRYIVNKKDMEQVFQSDFQKDVYSFIKSGGYKIKPEIKVGGYNIDFMIYGNRSRVAVICDGDDVNSKYSFRESVERQLDLERVGWTFLRIRGSEFYLNPEKTVKKIFKKLEEMGIESNKIKNNSSMSIESLKVV